MSTAHQTLINGIPCVIPNRVVETGSEHWYISFNDHDTATYGGPTTAIVLGQVEYILILNGDHREVLNAIVSTVKLEEGTRLARCLAYVREHKDQINKYSDPVI